MRLYGGGCRRHRAGAVLVAALVLAASAVNDATAVAVTKTGGSAAEVTGADATDAAADADTGDGAGEDTRALAEAARTGKLVEISSMRGESSEVYATPEGNLEAREHCARCGPGSTASGRTSTPL